MPQPSPTYTDYIRQSITMTLLALALWGTEHESPVLKPDCLNNVVLTKGEALLLELPCPANNCEASFNGHPLPLFPPPNANSSKGAMAMIATPLDGQESYPLCARKKRGRWTTVTLLAQEPGYPEETLSVDPDLVFPPDFARARIEKERQEIAKALVTDPTRQLAGALVLPVELKKITSPFGIRRLYNGSLKGRHTGVDLRAAEGTPVISPQSGLVKMAQSNWYTGGHIILEHGFGITSSYFHLSELLVRPGDQVTQGQLIAKTGATGRVTGPHLHWGIHLRGEPVNPLKLVSDLEAVLAP